MKGDGNMADFFIEVSIAGAALTLVAPIMDYFVRRSLLKNDLD